MGVLVALAVLGLLVPVYLWLVNQAMLRVPDEVRKISPHRWTPEKIRETRARLEKKPVDFTPHLPPKLERRYIVVGSSGVLGGYMVLHLLRRGQPPESIRMIDLAAPVRKDLLEEAAKVPFFKTDVSSEESVRAAFDQPWDPSVANLPLTVMHLAAIINFSDRARSLLPKVSRVNLAGTANVLSAAKRAGADIFLSTSSGSVEMKPIPFWIWPWQKYPKHFVQMLDGGDAHAPLRDHYDYSGNYAVSKAQAEKLVLAANTPSFRTGSIRPTHAVFGNRYDHTVGRYLMSSMNGPVPTWVVPITENFVHAENASLAHLKFEEALLTPGNKVAGECFLITDPNPAITYGDIYVLLSTLTVTPFRIVVVPPVLIYLIAHMIEGYVLLLEMFPLLRNVMPPLTGDIASLQPTMFNICGAHVLASDAKAQRSVAEGGIGFRHGCTTLEGMVTEVMEWNEDHKDKGEEKGPVGNGHVLAGIRNFLTVSKSAGG